MKSAITTRPRPISLAVCASLPAVDGRLLSSTSRRIAFQWLAKGVRQLTASSMSTRAMTSSVRRRLAWVTRGEGTYLPS